MPSSLGCVNLLNIYGERDFADMIKMRCLRWEIIMNYLDEPNVIKRILIREKEEHKAQS